MILITGASGFLGRRVAARAARLYGAENVHCLAGAPVDGQEQEGILHFGRNKIRVTEVDLMRPETLNEFEHRPDVVIHLAANTRTWEESQEVNDTGTEHLLRALNGLGRGCHFLFTSSAAVMDNRVCYETSLDNACDQQLGRPFTRYGRSKLRAETLLQQYASERGFALSIVRPVTIYGPGFKPNTFLDALSSCARRGGMAARLNWPGLTGLAHVEDAAEAILGLAQMPPEGGSARTVVLSGESRTLAEASRTVHERLGLPYHGIRLPKIFWICMSQGLRRLLKGLQHAPGRFFVPFWRTFLVVENVFWCSAAPIKQFFPDWQPRKFEEGPFQEDYELIQ